MAARTDHPGVVQPTDSNLMIWRYMGFTKFLYLVAQQSLFFCRSDRFEDPFEGSYPRLDIDITRQKICRDLPHDMWSSVSDDLRWLRGWTYVNCWHMNQQESAAMWKLYSQSQKAIAIRTTYGKFVSVLPDKAYVGCVRYLDYRKELMPEGDSAMLPFFHKRKSFTHENEVRAVIRQIPSNEGLPPGIPRDAYLRPENPDRGESIPIDIRALIEMIYVGPMSAQWYLDLVKKVTQEYHISAPVLQSSMDDPAIF